MLTLLVGFILFTIASFSYTLWSNRRAMRRAEAELEGLDATGLYPILMPVHNRPKYLHQVIEALSSVKDIDQTVLIISQDGSHPEVTQLVEAIDFTTVVIMRHKRPWFGVLTHFWDSLHAASTNVYFLLCFAFTRLKVKGAIVLEDDILPAVDFYRYYRWCFRYVLNDPQAMSVTAFNIHSRLDDQGSRTPQARPYDLVRTRDREDRDVFEGWGWAITREQWLCVRRYWSFASWDSKLNQVQSQLGLRSYKPVLARAKNIGMQGINFAEADDAPRWMGVYISQGGLAYDREPNLVEREEPAFLSPGTQGKRVHKNEKERTRTNRYLLVIAILLVCLFEAIFLYSRPIMRP